MSPRLHKLIWSEGMYLAPHHFQAQSRFFEDSIHFSAGCFWQFCFGFLGLEIDENELRHGSFQLHSARGIMPDGLVFELSEKDDLPPCRSVDDLFPSTGQPLTLFLGVKPYREGQQNVLLEAGNGHASTRFRKSVKPLTDFNTGQDLKPVDLLRPDLKIVTEAEKADDVALPVARIIRQGNGQYALDPLYAPPCLNVTASARLKFLLDRLFEILVDKSHSLSQRRRNGASVEVRGDQRELLEFWLLHTVNSSIPVLRLWKTGRSPHPMELYRGLSQLAGALCTFASASDPIELPAYDHMALGDCLGKLDQHIQRHLELGLPTNCITVPLRKSQPFFFEGVISDPRCFGNARWVLGIKSDTPETVIISQTPSMVKVSASNWIERVVRQAVPGAPLTYLPVPPAAIPSEFGVSYFSIDRDHPLFEPVRKFGSIGIYVPGELRNAELALHVVIGGTRT